MDRGTGRFLSIWLEVMRLSSSGIDGGREGPIGSSGFGESGTGRCVAFGCATCGYDKAGDYNLIEEERVTLSFDNDRVVVER